MWYTKDADANRIDAGSYRVSSAPLRTCWRQQPTVSRRGACIMPIGIYQHKTVPIEQRFWRHVVKTETCWLWSASRDRKGYGQLGGGHSNPKRQSAHRLSWILHYGPIPPGLFVLHRCDNPPCVRPDHLWVGTAKENTQDAAAKGRMAIGERNGAAKLTKAQVIDCRERYARGAVSHATLAREKGVGASTVRRVIQGRNWQ